MLAEDQFIKLTALLCEPVRARMLWNLLDGKAYTATELSHATDSSATSTSNHLSKLLEANLVKVESQGRHRYYCIARPEVAYAVESLASLVADGKTLTPSNTKSGIRYCRTCYDHLAGFVGVQVTEGMEAAGYLRKEANIYIVTPHGWTWLSGFGIEKDIFARQRRPLTRQCLDWSERRPHLAGSLGATLLETMLCNGWFKRIDHQRALVVTSKGSAEVYRHFKVAI
jgi:DNA-binding transcriptional ArsR family regulator